MGLKKVEEAAEHLEATHNTDRDTVDWRQHIMKKQELVLIANRVRKDQYERMKLETYKTGKSQAEILREALDKYFNE